MLTDKTTQLGNKLYYVCMVVGGSLVTLGFVLKILMLFTVKFLEG